MKKVWEYEEKYDAILAKTEEEYIHSPLSDYYKEGYNFFRFRKYKEHELLFLHDKKVSANNLLCEARTI